jgi:limonene-1,2-epoxide hydrolase
MHALCITAAAAVGLIERFASDVSDSDVESFDIRIENSPWVQFTVGVHMRGEHKFALWRSSGDVFAVGPDGAAGEDPVASLGVHLAAVA